MSMNIDSKLNNENGFWDVSLQGELDVSTADKLKEHLHNLADEKILDMKINLENLDYIDSTGLGAMIGVLKKLKTDNKEIYIIGGDSCVSEAVKLELDKLDLNKSSERVAGLDRKETNAKVISKFYESEDVLELFVAKDGYVGGKNKLVDALAAAPLSATKLSPILLTTDGLNELQQGSVEELNNVEKVTKVGNGITKNTIELIIDLLEK